MSFIMKLMKKHKFQDMNYYSEELEIARREIEELKIEVHKLSDKNRGLKNSCDEILSINESLKMDLKDMKNRNLDMLDVIADLKGEVKALKDKHEKELISNEKLVDSNKKLIFENLQLANKLLCSETEEIDKRKQELELEVKRYKFVEVMKLPIESFYITLKRILAYKIIQRMYLFLQCTYRDKECVKLIRDVLSNYNCRVTIKYIECILYDLEVSKYEEECEKNLIESMIGFYIYVYRENIVAEEILSEIEELVRKIDVNSKDILLYLIKLIEEMNAYKLIDFQIKYNDIDSVQSTDGLCERIEIIYTARSEEDRKSIIENDFLSNQYRTQYSIGYYSGIQYVNGFTRIRNGKREYVRSHTRRR